MRILVVGAGGIGGYFGGRLLEAGRDVTFLVRPGRAGQLARTGLCLRSPAGDVDLPQPKLLHAGATAGPFDLVLLSCKAYDLPGAIEAMVPYVGANTAILPLLNGMVHLDALDASFGPARVLGGMCLIQATLDADGRVLHLAPPHVLTFGARPGPSVANIADISAAFTGAKFDVRASEIILQEMWEKWVFIATAAGLTCLMRGTIGDLVAAGGTALANELLAEAAAIAAAQGFPPREGALQRARAMFTAAGSALTASMFRDLEQGGRIESEQILSDLLRRGDETASPVLRVAVLCVKTYEARRAREAASRVST
jgi:2-dehydropantoate 2-reductase